MDVCVIGLGRGFCVYGWVYLGVLGCVFRVIRWLLWMGGLVVVREREGCGFDVG